MLEWIKTNIIATLSFTLILMTAIISLVQYHSNIENRLNAVVKDTEENKKHIEIQNDIERRLSLTEARNKTMSEMIAKQGEIINAVVNQNIEIKSQSIIIDNTVNSLNTTLDKVNNTLDKLNDTVNTINFDIVEMRSDIEHIQGEINE